MALWKKSLGMGYVTSNDKATITETGAILLGENFACDGFEKNRPVGLVTHAHEDNTAWLESGLYWHRAIIATPQTRDLLVAQRGDWLDIRKYLIPLKYETPYRIGEEGEEVTLYPTKHMLGSAQVLVRNREGRRYLYTGDFYVPQTPVIETDVLVVDSTYGSPDNVRKYTREEASKGLIELVRKGLVQEPVWISAHFGKLQETINLLAEAGIKVPFLIDTVEDMRGARIYQKYEKNMGNCLYRVEGRELLRKGEPCVVFTRHGKVSSEIEKLFHIHTSGWAEFDGAVLRRGEKSYRVALSDHADFKETLEHIRKVNPELVITDNTRGSGDSLAEAVREKLGIKAIKMP